MNAVLGDLPTWNLSDLYSSPSGTDLDADLKRATRDAEAFAKDYEGKVASLDGKTLGAAVVRFEALSDLMGRIGSYASSTMRRTRPIPSAASSCRTCRRS